MQTTLLIALGGALGAVTRFFLHTSVQRYSVSGFPLGTLVVNVLGSFLIGITFVVLVEKIQIAEQWRAIVIIGFLGAMTTFSTFSLDALLLLEQGHYNSALLYILSSVFVCLIAAFAGLQLARLILI